MKRPLLIAIALIAALIVPVSSGSAFGRDSDGSRMQARPLAFESSADDRLSPPRDAVDWRYVRLGEAADVTIAVNGTPSNVALAVTLTDAMGKPITRGKTSEGRYTTRRRLDPGLYYVAVSARRAVTYKLSVR